MISFKDQHFISKGEFCYCYEHPTNKTECIKTPTEHPKAKRRMRADLKFFHRLHKKNLDLRYIANYLGEISTSQGVGYRFECVRNHDTSLSQTLESYLQNSTINHSQLYKELYKLASYLVRENIMIGDIHSRNILIQIDQHGGMTPIIVDGLGDRVAIPILNMIPKLANKKIIRRWNRFAHKELKSESLIKETP